MSTSEQGHYVRFGASLVDDERPVDTGIARRAISSINHIADQYGQARVVWAGHTPFDAPSPPPAEYNRLGPGFPFSIRIRDAVESYAFRCRLLVRRVSGDDNAEFALTLAAPGLGRVYLGATGPNVGYTTANSTTYVWREMGPTGGGANLLRLGVSEVAEAQRTTVARDAVGGSLLGVSWVEIHAQVWTKSETPLSLALGGLAGIYVAEFEDT